MIGLGLRARKGGAVAVAVGLQAGEPRVLVSTFLATAETGDRLAFEPYGLAAELARGPGGVGSAQAAVEEGRRRQETLAAKELGGLVGKLKPAAVALLVNRAGWITYLLSYSLAWAEHVPVAEGLAVREAFRGAVRQSGVQLIELDEKSLPDLAAQVLGGGAPARLKEMGAEAGRPWRKEQKLACLAAWMAIAGHPGT